MRRVNVSLDSLDPVSFHRITRGGHLQRVICGTDTACGVGMHPVKVNMVVMQGVNDHEIDPMLEFAVYRGLRLRFIEIMPVGAAGQRAMAYYYLAMKILERMRRPFGAELIPEKPGSGAGPARCYRLAGTSATVGIISAISRHFCEGCNRARLTARGKLVLCLGAENRAPLDTLLRTEASDAELVAAIRAVIARKPERHRFLKRNRRGLRMGKPGG